MKRYLMTALALVVTATLASAWSSKNADRQKVVDDLKTAFAGETTASAKYTAYAGKARSEGLPKIALLFEAASKAESIHAGNHKAALEQLGESAPDVTPKYDVKTTKENLKDALLGNEPAWGEHE